MSLKRVLVCSRPGQKGRIISSPQRSGQGVDHSPDAGGKGANPTPQDTLAATREFFGLQTTKGGEGFAALPPKSGGSRPPLLYLPDTANLDGPVSLPFTETKTCTLKYMVLGCGCSRSIVPSTCMSTNCTLCQPHVGQRRAGGVFRRLMQTTSNQHRYSPPKPVIYTVFTIPPHKRELYLDPKKWSKFRKEVWTILKKDFGGLYGMEASHPCGDIDPTRFHPHLNFVWRQRPGFRGFIDEKKLKDAFRGIVETSVVDVWTAYTTSVGLIKKWVNYTCRTFPGNHVWTGPIRWFGKYPRGIKSVPETCFMCGQRFKVIGTLEKSQVDQWYKIGWALGIDPPWERDSQIKMMKNSGTINAIPSQS